MNLLIEINKKIRQGDLDAQKYHKLLSLLLLISMLFTECNAETLNLKEGFNNRTAINSTQFDKE